MTGITSQISWFNERNLIGVVLIPIIVLILIFGYRRICLRLLQAQTAVPDPSERWAVDRFRVSIKGFLFVLALLCLIISSAGPRLGWTWIESKQSGIDIVVAVDVSRSMMARDLEPTRLERARRMILDLLDVAEGDRIGLVVFAGAAFVQCPLTVDHGAMRSFVDALSTDMIPVGGTDIAGALRDSLKALDAGGEKQGMGKLIVLMTDGEDHAGDVDAALRDVIKSQARVVTVGLASSDGAPVIDENGGFIKNRSGEVIVSRLNEEPLRKIADETDGKYVNAASSGASVADFYQNVIRAKGTARESQARRERVWFERFQWSAALALALLLLEIFFQDVRRYTVTSLLFIASIVSIEQEALAKEGPLSRYNKAVIAFESGDVEYARREFSDLAKTAEGETRRRSLYNLGNLLAVSGQLEEATKAYEEALSMDYQDQQVRDNLSWVKKHSDHSNKNSDSSKDKQQNKKDKQEQSDQKNPQNDPSGQQQNQSEKQKQQNAEKESQAKENQKNENLTNKNDEKSSNEKKDKESKEERSVTESQKPDRSSQEQEMTAEQAEKLLRAAPDDRKAFVPIFRSEKVPPPDSQGKNW